MKLFCKFFFILLILVMCFLMFPGVSSAQCLCREIVTPTPAFQGFQFVQTGFGQNVFVPNQFVPNLNFFATSGVPFSNTLVLGGGGGAFINEFRGPFGRRELNVFNGGIGGLGGAAFFHEERGPFGRVRERTIAR